MSKSSKEIDADRFFEQSRAAEKGGDLVQALEYIERAIEFCPLETVYWSAKAQYLKNSKLYNEAKSAAQKAIEINRKNYHAWGMLGLANSGLGNYEEAASCFRRSVEIKKDANVYTLLAAVECEFDLKSAIMHAKKALEMDPNWDEAQDVLRAAQEKLKKEDGDIAQT